MRYRRFYALFLLCPAIFMLFTACGTGQKNGITMYQPEGVYQKEEIPFAEDFRPAMSYDCGIQIHNDTVYLCGKSSENISIFCTNLNTGETSLVDTGITGIPFGFCVTDTGYGIVVMNTADYITNTTMYSITADGTVLDTAVLSNTWYAEESDPFVWYSDGTVYLTSENSGTLVRVNLTEMTASSESLPNSVVSVSYDTAGKAYLLLSGLGTRNLYTIENNVLTEIHQDINFRSVFSDHVFALNDEIYYYDSDGIKKHGENKAILDFIDSGLVYTNIESLTVGDMDEVFCLYRSPLTQELIFYRMNKTAEENIREKIQIEVTFAENGKSFVQLAASMFNAVSEEYHVVCDIYRNYGSDDYDALLNRFEKAILKGDVGDIIVYSDEEFLRKYSSVFLDLTGYVNPDKYFRCVMDSLKVNDAVYAMSPYFTVYTLVGLKENLPSAGEWTTETFLEMSDTPEGVHLLSINSRSYMQEILLMNRLEDYISGTENTFDSEEFIALLEHLKTYPEENQLHIHSTDNAFMNGTCILRNTTLSSLNIYIEEKMRFGVLEEGELCYIGFPNDSGNGIADVNFDLYFSVNRNSHVVHGALEFIDFLMNSSDLLIEAAGHSYMPSSKSVFTEWLDYEGAYPYVCHYPSMTAIPKQDTSEDENYPVVAIDDQFKNKYYTLIDSLTVGDSVPIMVTEIVKEELSAFYARIHTAEETAEMISNRVALFLGETN